MIDNMINSITSSSLAKELIVFIISALPVTELRLALPIAINGFNMPWPQALLLCFLGNILPIPFLLLFYDSMSKLLCRTRRGKKFVDWVYNRTRRQTGFIEKHKHLGLIIFVAIPIPGTGAWTASIAAHLLGMKFIHALLDIIAGVIGAGIIVSILILLGWVGAGIAIAGFILIVILAFWKRKKADGKQ